MTQIVLVSIGKNGKIYKFDAGGIELSPGDQVVVETQKGLEIGFVAETPVEIENQISTKPLQKVLRKANKSDLDRWEQKLTKREEAFTICEEKIKAHKMDMKLIDVDYAFDGSKIIFHFTAEGRVDFRNLVKDLASVFKTRIELRQIGVRDEARKIGGLGPCGRPCCCNAFLNDFQPVSIKMAKEQNLSLSPTKISGLCGRLMCCLNYENEFYHDIRKKLPRIGAMVQIPGGQAEVAECNGLKETVKVKVQLADGTIDLQTFPLSEISWKNKQCAPTCKNNSALCEEDDSDNLEAQ